MLNPNDLSLYLVTDRPLCNGRTLMEVVAEAVQGGVTMVQLREKHADTREFIELARGMVQVLGPSGVPLLINDRVDVALAVGAHGVHVGQADMPCVQARQLMGPEAIIGLSVETMDQVREAEAWEVDYLGVSPVFASTTKADTGAPWGLEGVEKIRRDTRKPLVGIGSIGADNAAEVIAAGADGVAVVSAICSAQSPHEAARSLAAAVHAARH